MGESIVVREHALQRHVGTMTTQLVDIDDQDRAIAIVMHRWIVGILDTDFLDPAVVVHNFFRELTSHQSSQSPGRWTHSAGRAEWSEKDFKTKLAITPGSNFNITIINSTLDRAVIVGTLENLEPDIQIRIRLELESEGWRIRLVEWIFKNQQNVVFE